MTRVGSQRHKKIKFSKSLKMIKTDRNMSELLKIVCKKYVILILVHLLVLLRELFINPFNPELNPICYLLALLGAHYFFHVSRIRVKLLTFRLLMLYIYGAPILDVSRSHTSTQHSR